MTALQQCDAAQSHWQHLRSQVDVALDRYLRGGEGCPTELAQAMRYSVLAPGKRLRPLLVLLSAKSCGGTVEAAMPVACAVELIHAYSLVHDDLPAMDDDDLRRGRPTCHKIFGEGMAILVGDALQALAFEILAAETSPIERAARCVEELAHAAGATALVGGQADDLTAADCHTTAQQLEAIHRRKTGALFVVSLRLGAIVAGGNSEQIDALTKFGAHAGLAFQIVDDLLDVLGREVAMGKRVGKDHNHKVTYPMLRGVEASRRRAEELLHAACNALAPFGARAEPLKELACFITRRDH